MRWFLLLLMLSGCAVADVQGDRQSKAAMDRYNDLVAKQDWPAALETIRAEIRNPGLKANDFLVNIRIIGISALGNTAKARGFDAAYDREAETYYNEGMSHATSAPETQARLNTIYGTYFSNTQRNGRALPYFLKDLEFWQRNGDRYQIIRAYDALGSAYYDMGEPEASLRLKQKALALAKEYFQIGSSPHNDNQWLEYSKMLRNFADNITGTGDLTLLKETLSRYTAVSKAYLTPKYLASDFEARQFAIAGDFLDAAGSLAAAVAIGNLEAKENPALTAQVDGETGCTWAELHHAAGDTKKAETAMAACIDYLKKSGAHLGSGTLTVAGEIAEDAGHNDQAGRFFEQATQELEGTRGSFPVGQRATFFNSRPVKRAYWGAIRVATRRSAAAKDATPAFFDAVAATEQIRARQFGDLLDPEGGKGGEGAGLASFARSLPPKSVVVDLIVMDEQVVVLAFARDARKSAIIPMKRLELERRVTQLQDQVSDYTSDLKTVEAALTELSRALLGPVLPLMRDKSRVIVLTDGPLALIPFALWSGDASRYQPLITTSTIENAPSLRLLRRTLTAHEVKDRLLGVGDAAYPASFTAPGFSQQEIVASVTRRARKTRSGDALFPPLPETRTEVEAIAKLFPGGNADTMFGVGATKSAFLARDLSGYRFIHVATHGVLGGELPGLGEPALVLADDPKGSAFLTASEAQSLHLNATLTVLSACNTGNGALYAGEGVMGLSRAFLLAGSKAVLASMWPVESQSTEAMMVKFYGLQRSGQPTAEALRQAMLAIRTEKPHPAFWAPFILVGE